MLEQFINKGKKLFLLDALGAIVSAFFLGVVLRSFNSVFGVSRSQLLILAVIPIFFAVFDFYVYYRIRENWQKYLKGIAFLNTCYCCLTIALMIFKFESVTIWGSLYFGIELIVLGILILVELKASEQY